MKEVIITFLKKCGIKVNTIEQLDGLLIPRNLLLSETIYEKVQPDIAEIKKIFSSSALTSLHQKAGKHQKWPLLNLVRQILRACNYQMLPIRKSDGYTKDGKKKYIRYFQIKVVKDKTEET